MSESRKESHVVTPYSWDRYMQLCSLDNSKHLHETFVKKIKDKSYDLHISATVIGFEKKCIKLSAVDEFNIEYIFYLDIVEEENLKTLNPKIGKILKFDAEIVDINQNSVFLKYKKEGSKFIKGITLNYILVNFGVNAQTAGKYYFERLYSGRNFILQLKINKENEEVLPPFKISLDVTPLSSYKYGLYYSSLILLLSLFLLSLFLFLYFLF